MRNIVLVSLESTRADHCSFMGYERKTTPNLDKMAKRSLYFDNAIAPSPITLLSMVGMFMGEPRTELKEGILKLKGWFLGR